MSVRAFVLSLKRQLCPSLPAISTLRRQLTGILFSAIGHITIRKMVQFGQRQSDCWRAKINGTVGFQYPLLAPSEKPNPNFPWAEARLHTDLYLEKKGKITQQERDTLLRTLIQTHGATITLVAACAHAMSPEAVRSLLADENETVTDQGSRRLRFLRGVVVAHHVNPRAITESESNEALGAIQLRASHSTLSSSQRLEKLIRLLIAGNPSHSLTYPYIRRMAQIGSVELSSQVKALRDSCSWLKAHTETKWLSILLDDSIRSSIGGEAAIELLSMEFPAWKAWAEWGASDLQLAQALNPYSTSNTISTSQDLGIILKAVTSTSRNLEIIINAVIGGITSNLFPSLHIRGMIRSYSSDLSLKIKALTNSGLWLRAHAETEWLSGLLDLPLTASIETREAMKLLQEEFPDWSAWAKWGESDSQLTQTLIPYYALGSSATGWNPNMILPSLVMAGIPTQSLLRPKIHSLVLEFSDDLAEKLQALKAEGQWLRAHKEAKWLSKLLEQALEPSLGRAEAIQVFEDGFPGWRAWAKWKPNIRRLNTQAELTTDQRCSLQDLLALDGPDFERSKQATMRDGLIAKTSNCLQSAICWGSVELKNQMLANTRDVLERLSNAVEAACRAGSDRVNLLIHLCCNGNPIEDGALRILEGINILGKACVASDVLHLLEAKNGERDSQRTAIMKLLPVLGQASGQTLCEALSPCLVKLTSTCMQELQDLLRKQLDNSNLVMELHVFGLALQATPWLLPLLEPSLGILLSNWPTTEKILDTNTLKSDILKSSWAQVPALRLQLNEYYTKCLIETGAMDLHTESIIETLIHLWHQKPNTDRRELALIIAQNTESGYNILCECLRQLLTLPDAFVCNLRQILQTYAKEGDGSCTKLARLLAATSMMDYETATFWRSVLHHWIKDRESTLLQYTLTHLTVDDWFQWLSDLYEIFTDMEGEDSQTLPGVLQPALHAWAHRISPYLTTISRIESAIGSGPATQCFLTGYNSDYSSEILRILEFLEYQFPDWNDGDGLQSAVLALIAVLNCDYNSNVKEIYQALSILTKTTRDVHDAYLRILEAHQGPSPQIVPALLVGWLQNPDLSNVDRQALHALGNVLGIRPDDDSITKALESVGYYVTDQVTSLFAELERLSSLRRSLRAMDPEGTSTLLAELGIDDYVSPLEDEIASLPQELVNVIELVDEDIVELHFPLTHHTELQQVGMGTSGSQSLIVRLVLQSSYQLSGFCMHFDNELNALADSNGHSPWMVFDDSSDKGNSFCHGHVNRAKYQLGHILSLHLLDGSRSLEETYNFLKLILDNLSQSCVICGVSHQVRLRRSTVCQRPSCSATFLLWSNFNIQLSDLQADIQVGDLLLTAVQAAATSSNTELLPECPVETLEDATRLLGTLPSVKTMQASRDLHAIFNSLGKPSEVFLKWIFTNYGGFLVSASGRMRIPSLPGAYQFLLANAAPSLEKAFAMQMRGQPTKVVFHGTSLERLYAILCQGLRVCSGSPLQRHGAAYGNGIYVAEEPATALGYATAYAAPDGWDGWHSSTFNHTRVLLGCEASGHIPSQRYGIYVVPDPNMLILRYIFLMPRDISAPVARHIVPAMASVFASLRSGGL